MADRFAIRAIVLGVLLLILAAPASTAAVECTSRRCGSMVSPIWAGRMGEAARSLCGGQPALALVLEMADLDRLRLASPVCPAAAGMAPSGPRPVRLSLLDLPPPASG